MNFQNVHGRYEDSAPKSPGLPHLPDIPLAQCPHNADPAFNHLLCFNCAEKVSKLINLPVVSLLGTRVCGTSTEMITQSIYLKFPATTSRKCRWFLRNHWDLGIHGSGKECLSETYRPGFISTVRPDLPQPTHRLEEEDTLRGILFLRLKASHLRPKYRVLNGNHYALL